MWDGPKFISIRTMEVYMLGRKQLRKSVTDNVKVTKATSSMPMFLSEISLQEIISFILLFFIKTNELLYGIIVKTIKDHLG